MYYRLSIGKILDSNGWQLSAVIKIFFKMLFIYLPCEKQAPI